MAAALSSRRGCSSCSVRNGKASAYTYGGNGRLALTLARGAVLLARHKQSIRAPGWPNKANASAVRQAIISLGRIERALLVPPSRRPTARTARPSLLAPQTHPSQSLSPVVCHSSHSFLLCSLFHRPCLAQHQQAVPPLLPFAALENKGQIRNFIPALVIRDPNALRFEFGSRGHR